MSRSWACATACGFTSKTVPSGSPPRSKIQMPTPEIVRATGVSKGFAASGGRGRTEAVRGVDFVVGQAELVVLLGRAGAGKSTLLSLVGGIDSPDAGTILVAGHDVGRLRGRAREEYLRNTVGWVFSSAGLLPLLTAMENVWLAARLLGHRDSVARKEALQALDAVGLGRALGTARLSSRAVSSSVWPWPGHWSRSLPCCWRTSRPPSLTARPASRSWT